MKYHQNLRIRYGEYFCFESLCLQYFVMWKRCFVRYKHNTSDKSSIAFTWHTIVCIKKRLFFFLRIIIFSHSFCFSNNHMNGFRYKEKVNSRSKSMGTGLAESIERTRQLTYKQMEWNETKAGKKAIIKSIFSSLHVLFEATLFLEGRKTVEKISIIIIITTAISYVDGISTKLSWLLDSLARCVCVFA